MKFQEFKLLQEAGVNSHMAHAQDLVFIEGVSGTKKTINFLRDVRDMLRNDGGKSSGMVQTKWDGAPAIVTGIDPTDGKFFVAKKGIFNKTPKVYKTQEDIDADLQGELHTKFSLLLPELKKLNIRGIIQGDLMFTKDDLKTETIDGISCVVFHPNTIAYAAPIDSDLGRSIMRANIGIVFHTKYTGSDFASLSANFGEELTKDLKHSDSAWVVDATYKDLTGKANFTMAESAQVDKQLTRIGKLFQASSADIINHFQKDAEAQSLVLIYINSRVRQAKAVESGSKIAADFLQFVIDRYQKEIEAKKSQKGQDTQTQKRIRLMQYLTQISMKDLATIFDLAYAIDAVKNDMVNVLNRASNLKTLIKTKDGFKVTGQEGFVAINTAGDAIKLVDRFSFSYQNFSPDVLKGWSK